MSQNVVYIPLLYIHEIYYNAIGDYMDLILLGKHIKKLRKETGLSQESFALSIGMDRTYYSSIEKGKHNITILNLYKIAKGLKISLSELLKNIE